MAKTDDIRRHIAAVEQTHKITGAMEMISSNRMRQVLGHIDQNRLYFTNIRRMMRELLSVHEDLSHPFFVERDRKRTAFMVISSDKGLCGSHNANVLNFAMRRLQSKPGSSLITMGNTAEEFFRLRGITPDITFLGIVQDPTLTKARELARHMTKLYEDELVDEIHFIFTSYYGKFKGRPFEFRLLPIILHDYEDVSDAESLTDILYHPSPQSVFDILVPQFVIGLVFGVMVQAYAAEHLARMNAMRSATSNAQKMKDDLRIHYNLARQSAITNEISEISGAAEIINRS